MGWPRALHGFPPSKLYPPKNTTIRRVENDRLCPECKRGNPVVEKTQGYALLPTVFRCRFCSPPVFWVWGHREYPARRLPGTPRPKSRRHGTRIDTIDVPPPSREPIRKPE